MQKRLRMRAFVGILVFWVAACADDAATSSHPPDASVVPDADLRIELPVPTGPAAVGLSPPRVIVDPARLEEQTDDPADVRKLLIQVWYPADPNAAGVTPPYFTDKEAAWLYARYGAGPGWRDGIKYHARLSVPFAAGGQRHPVLLFSHGLGETRTFYTSLIEDVVSHGYVVVAIAHLYDSAPVELPDGTLLEHGPFSRDWEARTIPELDAHLAVWSSDVATVLDEVEVLDAADPQGVVTGRLDLQRIGMFGHSYGGSTSAEAAIRDGRLKAGVDLDGAIRGMAKQVVVPVPYMLIRNHNELSYVIFWFMANRGYDVVIQGAGHSSYADTGIMRQSRGTLDPAWFGTMDQRRVIEIARAYVLAFFERHLRDGAAPLLDGPPPYGEVTVTRQRME